MLQSQKMLPLFAFPWTQRQRLLPICPSENSATLVSSLMPLKHPQCLSSKRTLDGRRGTSANTLPTPLTSFMQGHAKRADRRGRPRRAGCFRSSGRPGRVPAASMSSACLATSSACALPSLAACALPSSACLAPVLTPPAPLAACCCCSSCPSCCCSSATAAGQAVWASPKRQCRRVRQPRNLQNRRQTRRGTLGPCQNNRQGRPT